jgi:prepilin-type N-terminal cleavage/methylation domain-containing protein
MIVPASIRLRACRQGAEGLTLLEVMIAIGIMAIMLVIL